MIRALTSIARAGLCALETLAQEAIALCDRVEQSYAPGTGEPSGEPPLNTGPWSLADLEALRGGFTRPGYSTQERLASFRVEVAPEAEQAWRDRERLDDLAHAGHGDRFADLIRDDEQTREEANRERAACPACGAMLGDGHTLTCENAPQPCAGEPASVTQIPRRATQCASIGYGPEQYRCELNAGHDGRHQRHSEPGADGFAWCETWADPPARPPRRLPDGPPCCALQPDPTHGEPYACERLAGHTGKHSASGVDSAGEWQKQWTGEPVEVEERAYVVRCRHCGRMASFCAERPCDEREACAACCGHDQPCIADLV